jgi:purine-binding chemotaxis protein CheW
MPSDGPIRLLVFRLGSERFAVELSAVDEVIDAPAPRPIPDAPASVLGVATVHDVLVTLYDPYPLLNLSRASPAAVAEHGEVSFAAALVFRWRGRRVGLVVDDVYDAMATDPNEVRGAPGSTASDGVLLGVIRRDGDLIAVLDPAALLTAATMATEGEIA